jgi:hypothetical protein
VEANIADGAVSSDKLATGIDAIKLADGTITNSELQYINSLSSNAQTQIDGAGGGKVLQVQHTSTQDVTSVTNTTTTIATITMTKISNTSKLLITAIAYLGMLTSQTNQDGANPKLGIYNDTTLIKDFYFSDVPTWYTSATYNGAYDTHPYMGQILYTVGSGSKTINMKLSSGSIGVWCNRPAAAAGTYGNTGLTVMEIEV